MEPKELLPSEVRERCLAEHRRLRESARRLAAQVRGCDCTTLRQPIAQGIATLLDQLYAHLTREAVELEPLLANIDPWGPQRAAHLEEQRRLELGKLGRMLERLSEPIEEGPLRAHVLEFVDWIDNQLSKEEREHLDADLLRDDLIVRDGFGG